MLAHTEKGAKEISFSLAMAFSMRDYLIGKDDETETFQHSNAATSSSDLARIELSMLLRLTCRVLFLLEKMHGCNQIWILVSSQKFDPFDLGSISHELPYIWTRLSIMAVWANQLR